MREKRKIIQYAVLIALTGAVLLAGARSSRVRDTETAAPPPLETSEPTPTPLALSDRTDHPALMARADDGSFYPERALTYGEVAMALAALTDGLPTPAAAMWLRDQGEESIYRSASSLTEAEIILLEDGEAFRPEKAVSREELAGVLDRLGLRMAGEEQVLVRAIASAVAEGSLLEGTDRKVSAEQSISRWEGAVILERLAGREPDAEALFDAGLKPVDVSREDWTWPFMADAALEGEIPTHKPGLFRMYGWLYKAGRDGAIVTDTTDGVWTFGPDGRYTTGNAALDKKLVKALAASGANELAGQEALAAAYLYVKENFEYKVTPLDETPEEVGSTGWEFTRAARFFRYKGGTCYGYAATFGLMARALGENAQIVAAQVNQYYGDHAFVVIPEDGVDWIYDVELEDARPERHQDLGLFHIQNFDIYNYWYTPDW